MTTGETIQAIAAGIALFSFGVSMVALYFTTRAVRLNSEAVKLNTQSFEFNVKQAKKRFAIELMQRYVDYSNATGTEIVDLREILHELNHDAIVALVDRQEFTIQTRFRSHLQRRLGGFHKPELLEDGNMITVTADQSKFLKSRVASILNDFEILAVAYTTDAVDRDIIRSGFKDILFPKKEKILFGNFLEPSGTYPTLRRLLEQERKQFLASHL